MYVFNELVQNVRQASKPRNLQTVINKIYMYSHASMHTANSNRTIDK